MSDIMRNGFPVVTGDHIIDCMDVARSELTPVGVVLAAIQQLAGDNTTIGQLARHGREILHMVDNDLDGLRECAQKAGVAGEMMPEVSHA